MYFIGGDQNDKRIRLFNNHVPGNAIDIDRWVFPRKINFPSVPNDIKRADTAEGISVLVATGDTVYRIPFNYQAPAEKAKTFNSCHSVELLPDGNLISVCSKSNKIVVHYGKESQNNIVRHTKKQVYDCGFGHGVVYDKKRNLVWAIGRKLLKYQYENIDIPTLTLLEEYELEQVTGHDLIPNPFNDSLLFTINLGIYEFDIASEQMTKLSDLKKVKSISIDHRTGHIYATLPKKKLGLARFQTDTIVNLNTKRQWTRRNSKFYKARLWQSNPFSY